MYEEINRCSIDKLMSARLNVKTMYTVGTEF